MTIKKGYLWNTNPSEVSAQAQFVYYIAVRGMDYDQQFNGKFIDCQSDKRGLVLQPYLNGDEWSIQDIASFHYQKLTEVNPHFQNEVPIIIDIFANPNGAVRLDLDNIKEYANYLTSRIDFNIKPLIRVTVGQWNNWMRDVPTQALALLDNCELLLSNPGDYPSVLSNYGLPYWWEYSEWGFFAYDSNRFWDGFGQAPPVVVDPLIEDPPIEKPVVEEPIVDPVENSPKKYKISLLGGFIRGTIEEI